MNFKHAILITILLLVADNTSLQQEQVTEPIKTTSSEDLQKVYRCCNSKCYLVESYVEQNKVVREVSHEEIYRTNDPLILSSRHCPEKLIIN